MLPGISAIATSPNSRHKQFPTVPRKTTGMSLIEVMVGVAILALLAMFGIPQMNSLVVDTQLSTNVNHFIAANALARAEAIQRGRLVTICRSVGADVGSDACSSQEGNGHASNDWGAGWLVFVEGSSDPSGIGVVDEGDEIIARQGALPEHFQGSSSIRKITYNPSGQPINLSGANLLFHADGKYQRMLCIARSGRLRVVRNVDHCSAG